jgi:thiol-disulfide isomerase/thioredoxin
MSAPKRSVRSSKALILIMGLLLAVAGCSADAAGQQSQTGSEEGYVSGDQQFTRVEPSDRQPAPEISGPSVTGDETISSADYSGEVLVINVWGSWCAPCRKEAPDLQRASEETADIAQFLGINSRDSGKAQPAAFMRSFGITYPSIYDPDGSQVVKFTDLPPSAIPSTLIIDQQGRVAVRVLGTVSESSLVSMIEDVAADK